MMTPEKAATVIQHAWASYVVRCEHAYEDEYTFDMNEISILSKCVALIFQECTAVN